MFNFDETTPVSDNPYAVSNDSYGRDDAASSGGSAGVTQGTIQILEGTRPWVRLIGIVAWIVVAFMAVVSIFVLLGAVAGGQLEMAGFAIAYVLLTVIYGYTAKCLTDYASRITTVASTYEVSDLESALDSQRAFWKVAGVITAIFLVLYLGMIVLMVAGVGGGFLGGAFDL